MSKRLLIIDTYSNAVDFSMRCMQAGWEVKYYDQPRRDGTRRLAGEGLVEKLYDLDEVRKKYLGWASLIFLPDNTAYLSMLEPYRALDYPIFGPSEEAAKLELDRAVGQAAMKKAGLNIIPTKEFNDYEAAERFVMKNPEYLVSKPSGDADKALSYVADSQADLVYMLRRWSKNEKQLHDAKKHGFILQQKKTGTEFAVGGWYGPGGWSKFWYENFEYKKLMVGDLGPATGEMGTVSMYVRKSKLADKVLKPMTEQLRALRYVGFIDVNSIIDDQGEIWPMEFTMRPGWPTWHNQVATHEGDPAQWMLDLVNGRDTLKVKENQVCVSVVVAIPDFPYSKLTRKDVTGIPIYNAVDMDRIHLCEVMGADVPTMVGGDVLDVPGLATAGDYVAVCCGVADTITGARRSAYASAKRIRIPNSPFYRTDIGAGRLVKQLPKIQAMGFATGFKF